MLRRITALLLCTALVLGLAACSFKKESQKEDAANVTEVTEPGPTVPADGNPNDVTCQGSYSASDDEAATARDAVVATMDGANLTNSELQVYYWLEVAAHRNSNDPDQPDYSQGLDTQVCPIDSNVNSWQQYFLHKALAAWHAQKALVLMSAAEGAPAGEDYKPDLEKRAEYMNGMPATDVLYQWNDGYKPNRLHQAYLDAIPETLKMLADNRGHADTDTLAAAIAGAGAEGRDLLSYTSTANLAYMYFTEMGYHFEPTADEIQAYYQEKMSADAVSSGKTVDIRHILLVPENAEIAADGTVTANENDWARCEVQAKTLLESWQKRVRNTKFAQFAEGRVPEARFAEFAKDHSQDPGSRANGGLYVQLRKGQLMPELEEWCFNDARQAGDYEIIRSAAGYHIVYLCAVYEDWYVDAQNGLVRSLYEELVQGAMEKYPMDVDFSAVRLGQAANSDSFITPDDLLYPDVAHQRFPDMPLYLQQDYPDAPFGDYKVSTHGCGITTLAMVASFLADDELTPAELAAQFGYYCGKRGSEIVLFDDTPAEMGFYCQGRSYSWPEMDEALRNGQVVVSLQWNGYWTSGGHYIAMIELTEDERYVVRDSNLLNYKRRYQNHMEDNHSRGSISEAGQYYWIYEPKVTSIPTCVRCGGDAEGAPNVMFRSDYTCEKCLTAAGRRTDFLHSLAG